MTHGGQDVAVSTASRILVDQLGEVRLRLTQCEQGYCLSSPLPPIRTLVLSGGGAKGVAYAGAIEALSQHQVLASIREIRGTSAGALVAALLCCGMQAAELSRLTAQLALQALTARRGDPLVRLADAGRWWLRLFSPGRPLRQLVARQGRAALLARLGDWLAQADPQDVHYRQVAQWQQQLTQRQTPLCFDLLAQISQVLPSVKRLACAISFVDGRGRPPALRMLDADATPTLEIGRAVQASGALPILFSRVRLILSGRGQRERGFAFDGGCILNAPARTLLQPSRSMDCWPGEEELVLVFEAAPTRGWQAVVQRWFEGLIGMHATAARAWLHDQLAQGEPGRQVVQIPLLLPQGDFTRATLRLDLSPHERQCLQQSARETVERHLLARQQARQSHHYAALSEALLALDQPHFELLRQHGLPTPLCDELDRVARFRRQIDHLLWQLVQQAPAPACGAGPWREWERCVHAVLSRIGHWLSVGAPAVTRFDPARLAYVLARLQQTDCYPLRPVLDQALLRPAATRSALELAWLAQQEKRVIQCLLPAIQRQMIYPARMALWQRSDNQRLLMRLTQRLSEPLTLATLQTWLERLQQDYRTRCFGLYCPGGLQHQLKYWLKTLRLLRQGRGQVWGGVTAFAQKRQGVYDMSP